MGPKSNDWGLYQRKEKEIWTQRHTEENVWRQEQNLEWCIYKPRNAGGYLQRLAAEEVVRDTLSLRAPRREQPRWPLDFQLLGFTTVRKEVPAVFKPWSLWCFVMAVLGANAASSSPFSFAKTFWFLDFFHNKMQSCKTSKIDLLTTEKCIEEVCPWICGAWKEASRDCLCPGALEKKLTPSNNTRSQISKHILPNEASGVISMLEIGVPRRWWGLENKFLTHSSWKYRVRHMDLGLIWANIYHPCLQVLMMPTHVFKGPVGKPVIIYIWSVWS